MYYLIEILRLLMYKKIHRIKNVKLFRTRNYKKMIVKQIAAPGQEGILTGQVLEQARLDRDQLRFRHNWDYDPTRVPTQLKFWLNCFSQAHKGHLRQGVREESQGHLHLVYRSKSSI